MALPVLDQEALVSAFALQAFFAYPKLSAKVKKQKPLLELLVTFLTNHYEAPDAY